MELQRAVHHGIVLITIPLRKQPRKICMQAFIVTHDACPEVIKTGREGHQDNNRKYCQLISDGGQSRVNRAFQPGTLIFGVSHVFFSSWLTIMQTICSGKQGDSARLNQIRIANITQKKKTKINNYEVTEPAN